MNLTEKEVLEIFNKTEALLNGHFLLTSGRHSNKYFQCAKVLQYPQYNKLFCNNIANYFKDYEFETVICPAVGGIVVGQEIARQLGKRFIFAERENKKMSIRRGFKLNPGERVLVCEDVVTTGGSVFEVIDLVNQYEANIVGVGFIVDRSNGKVDFGYPQYSLIKMEVISYLKEECPICKEGLELVKPGSRKL